MSPWKADVDSSSRFNHNLSGTDGWVGGWMDEWMCGRVGGLADGWMERRKGGKKGEREGARKIREGRKMNEYLFPTPSLNAIFILFLTFLANFHRKASVIMVDELLSAYPHQLSFSEAGLRIMITSHFPPKTRLSMASRMLINEVSEKTSPSATAGVGNWAERTFPSLQVKAPASVFYTIMSLSCFPTFLLSYASLSLLFPPRVQRCSPAPSCIERLFRPSPACSFA